mgnify:CR=1 FL=1|jgi:hypothetical protein
MTKLEELLAIREAAKVAADDAFVVAAQAAVNSGEIPSDELQAKKRDNAWFG